MQFLGLRTLTQYGKWRKNAKGCQPLEEPSSKQSAPGPGKFPGKLTIVRNDPLEVVVGPLTSKKRAPRAPPKPKVDVNGNVLELKKRAPAKPKGKANIKDEKITIKDEKPAIETRRLLSKTRRLPEEVDGRVVEKKEGVKRS